MTITGDGAPPTFTEQTRRLRVTATSPDGRVRAHLDHARAVTVELSPDAPDRHTEQTLAREITAAVTRVAAGGNRGLARIHENRWGSAPTAPRTGPLVDYLERLKQRLSEIEVRALAPLGYVQVGYRGATGFDIRIEPGALRRKGVDHEQLAAEVNTAMERTLRDWTAKWLRLRAELSARR